MALKFSTSRLSSCSPSSSSSSRIFYGVFSPVADLLIGDPVENLEWIKQTSKMKYEATRFTMLGKSVFFFRTSYAATNGCRWSPDAKHGSVLLETWSLAIASALYAPISSKTRD